MSESGTELLTQLNEDLKSSVKFHGYADVKVLVLYWQDEHEGFKAEGEAVYRTFEDVFHYPVREFPIPSMNSLVQLSKFVLEEIPKDAERSSLCIIHYGGHGDRDDRKHEGQERRSVWAAFRDGHPTLGDPMLEWWRIQDLIRDLDTDILLILDCCYAGQSARGRESSRGGLEILAAAAMGVSTPPPGAKSFTSIFLQELQKAVDAEGFVNIKDLHGHLNDRERELWAQPVHIALKKGRASIVLKPLSTAIAEEEAREKEARSFLQLLIHIEEELNSDSAEQIRQWLRTNIPYIVSGLEVIDKTRHVQIAVQDIEQGEKPFVKRIDTVSKTQIVNAWKGVVTLVEKHLVASPDQQQLIDDGTNSVRVGELVKQLDAQNASVVDLIEQTILTSADADSDSHVLDDAIEDDTIKALEMTSQLRMRRLVRAGQAHDPSTTSQAYNSPEGVGDHDGNREHVVQEFKVYGEYIDPREMPAMEKRVVLLSKLLGEPKSTAFRALRCVGLSHQDLERQYTLTFEIPKEYDSPEFVNLDWIIQKVKGRERPSLNQRLQISLLLAKALYKWHLVGWLHQGISSPNVIFFRTSEKGRVPDYAKPFLHGFDFARPDSDPSMGRTGDDPCLNVYRHPERQGEARKGHHKKHDFYSLGVVMLEIGLWQWAPSLIKKGDNANKVRKILQQNCAERLAHFAGDSYKAAVDVCLSGEFGVELDDASGTHLLKAFQSKVIDELSKGVRL
ncbi:hypothetical protein F5Y13DRAFT_197189 [Hypoxylon sp. FL1857]|nr:hypothetical protein F5Y13DRAFT_197189 [Hypoxylon sp. FL1857]